MKQIHSSLKEFLDTLKTAKRHSLIRISSNNQDGCLNFRLTAITHPNGTLQTCNLIRDKIEKATNPIQWIGISAYVEREFKIVRNYLHAMGFLLSETNDEWTEEDAIMLVV